MINHLSHLARLAQIVNSTSANVAWLVTATYINGQYSQVRCPNVETGLMPELGTSAFANRGIQCAWRFSARQAIPMRPTYGVVVIVTDRFQDLPKINAVGVLTMVDRDFAS
jgi:hypothetical protein